MISKALILHAIITAFLLLIGLIFFKSIYIINFMTSYILSSVIIISTYVIYSNITSSQKIQNQAQQSQVSLGLKAFISFSKIVAYTALIGITFMLIDKKLFLFMPFFVGIGTATLSNIIIFWNYKIFSVQL